LEGYGAVFNSRSQPLGIQNIREQGSPAVFNKHKGDNDFHDVLARYDHKNEFILGSVRAGTLDLTIDERGLRYVVDLPPSRQDIYEIVARRDVAGLSFSFVAYEDDWEFVNGQSQRTLLSGKLLDIGPTPNPAYLGSTAVALRSLAIHRGADPADVESLAAQGELRRLWTRTDAPPVPDAAGGGATTEPRRQPRRWPYVGTAQAA
jgi:HK97 family phage prohead protease